MSGIRSREGVYSAILLVWFFLCFSPSDTVEHVCSWSAGFLFSAVYLLSVRYLKNAGQSGLIPAC